MLYRIYTTHFPSKRGRRLSLPGVWHTEMHLWMANCLSANQN